MFNHCTRDSRENDDFRAPIFMYTTPPYNYKRRGWASFYAGGSDLSNPRLEAGSLIFPQRTLSTTEHTSQPTPLLAETWELSSLSRLACIPYYKHPGCKIIQCPRTLPLLDVRPRGRNQDKPCVTVIASCIIIWDEETRSIY